MQIKVNLANFRKSKVEHNYVFFSNNQIYRQKNYGTQTRHDFFFFFFFAEIWTVVLIEFI